MSLPSAVTEPAGASGPRVLILTQYFPPEMGAPQARLSELGGRLQKFGWQVQVLTALPNYPTGRIFEAYRGRRHVRETQAGLDTIRLTLFPTQSASIVPRLTCYMSFVLSVIRWGGRLCERPDVIWIESPPLFLGLAARYLAWKWRVPVVFNVSDLWPDAFVDLGKIRRGGLAYRLLHALELSCYRHAAGVTGQSDEIIAHVRQARPGIPAAVISNGVDPERFGRHLCDEAWRKEAGWIGKCVFVFAGLHGVSQGLDKIVNVAADLRHRHDILFALIGDGPVKADIKRSAAAAGLENIRFYPGQPRERVPAILASADVALITLASMIKGAVPSKIYEAMATAMPILLVAEGEAANRVTRVGAGVVVSCDDRAGLARAVEALADDPARRAALGKAGRQAAETVYARNAVARTLADFLAGTIASRSSHASFTTAGLPQKS